MNNILYYPYINMPRTDWAMRVLLYFDNVGTIVPQDFFWEPEKKLDPHMWQLVKEGLVTPINPLQELQDPWRIGRPFLEFVDTEDFREYLRIDENARNWSRIHKDKFVSKIHADKFADNIFYGLTQLGLAERGEGDWYNVEKRTAACLMEYLATILSEKLDRRATTDTMPFTKLDADRSRRHSQRRAIILEKLMPFPADVEFHKILDFKMSYQHLLQTFRNRIESIVLDTDIDERSVLFENRIEELFQRKEELSARMNESKIKDIIFGSVCGVIGSAAGIITSGSIGGAIGALPGFFNAVHSALKFEKPESIFDQSGMKYLALADKKLYKR